MNPNPKPIKAKHVHCKLCAEPLPSGAVFCTKCNNFQDWRRFFNFSGVVLSLAIALISVVATGGPIIKQIFTPNRSHLQVDVGYFDEHGITFVISNSGNSHGLIIVAELIVSAKGKYFTKKEGTPFFGFILPLQIIQLDSSSRIVDAGKTKGILCRVDTNKFNKELNSYPETTSPQIAYPYDLQQSIDDGTIHMAAHVIVSEYGVAEPKVLEVIFAKGSNVTDEHHEGYSTTIPLKDYYYYLFPKGVPTDQNKN